jgi:hypothetical protein
MPLWPLPLGAGLLPAAAALLAFELAKQAGLVPACNPFIEGCVAISRAARHDLPNHRFRALVLPAAALQALTWLAAAQALHTAGGARWRRSAIALAAIGVAAGIALVLYAPAGQARAHPALVVAGRQGLGLLPGDRGLQLPPVLVVGAEQRGALERERNPTRTRTLARALGLDLDELPESDRRRFVRATPAAATPRPRRPA